MSRLQLNKKAFCLFESTEVLENSGRFSLLAIEPSLQLIGGAYQAEIKSLNDRGETHFNRFLKSGFPFEQKDGNVYKVRFTPSQEDIEENDRIYRPCAAQLLRPFLDESKAFKDSLTGLYGAFAYSFVYPFEEISSLKENQSPDFNVFFCDTVLMFDQELRQLEISIQRDSEEECEQVKAFIESQLTEEKKLDRSGFEVGDVHVSPSDESFVDQVAEAKELFKKGELMELVLSRKIEAKFQGNPLALYEQYKSINPSPYQFFIQFSEEEQLLGCSPEIMVRVIQDRVHLKPISGTKPRGKDAIEDHYLMKELLNSEKEKAELDMLIDLGRNDLSKTCEPGISIDAYRSVEKYARVFHTVARLSGQLRTDRSGYDALITCLNAGTLTGAPKHAAMQTIEKMEGHSRDYYGGCVGYLLPTGEVNTAITIRSAHIASGKLAYCSGATLLIDSDPIAELQETNFKAQAFVESLNPVEA